ncbi:MAG: D-alanyl-D-alanine carboxypeptidase/D-alanyl-D-alanine-endopeptidase [Bacteroidota bacterium]|nr:D-alanyl-D-alanine carboxypeptidase/D-alanyl-D-alanine-endopeptidase [Bacteroidota bacterium]MDP4233473.1 D-alanyl-D-alanine carboxypeptidase/D-alanyl-D-alanine-endopeptidase [Bacteroidota bacterium]MDP4243351.1 D-alanyl-D-alanine carboxypeptidase/D-alanyl-D-alanine-endopeptidase [Bacteroidota bacterium]MDP4287963.1 D-alanyl-D-alanine carboxypeptidase/D-alanyl-D-alanine-endopeptidase [Bacteroidota bacterium]
MKRLIPVRDFVAASLNSGYGRINRVLRALGLISSLLLSTELSAQTATDQLVRELDSLFHTSRFSNATFGVSIQSLKSGDFLYRLNDTKSLLPASNMKLFTAAEALALLGPEYRYKTEMLTNGKIKRHTLYGDLIFRGVGDPTSLSPIDTEDSWDDTLNAHEIYQMTGSFIADNSFFTPEYYPTGWQIDDLPYYYATPVSALIANENKVTLAIFPGLSLGSAAIVSWKRTPYPYGVILNKATTGSPSSTVTIDAGRKIGTDTIVVTGSIPLGDTEIDEETSIDNPETYAVKLLMGMCPNYRGFHQRAIHQKVLATHQSPPLTSIIQHMNKESDNLYAECLFRTVAKVKGGEGSWMRGIEVMRKYLASIGIDTMNLQFTDGSGLSRMDFVTTDAIIKLLMVVWKDPKLKEPFYNSLPIMGVDGTLKNQLKGTPAAGNVHAKTGSMTGVRSISGYLTTRDGEPIAFSILLNNFTAPGSDATKLENEVLTRLVNFSRVESH